ncbi:unnamed protein product [Discosporangium mesarthrocarpum]
MQPLESDPDDQQQHQQEEQNNQKRGHDVEQSEKPQEAPSGDAHHQPHHEQSLSEHQHEQENEPKYETSHEPKPEQPPQEPKYEQSTHEHQHQQQEQEQQHLHSEPEHQHQQQHHAEPQHQQQQHHLNDNLNHPHNAAHHEDQQQQLHGHGMHPVHHEMQVEDYPDPNMPNDGVGKRRKKRPYKKAPNAPRRGRSAYVLFSMEKRAEVKSTLAEGTKVTEIMKGIAAKWRELGADDKAVWNEKAAEDKRRYEMELSVYDGPLKVPNKRARKDPSAPKRAMSAFLHFSQAMRPRLRLQYPEAKNVDMSKMLGQEWNRMSNEEKAPYQAKAAEDTGRYRVAMDMWKQGEMAEAVAATEEQLRQGVLPQGMPQGMAGLEAGAGTGMDGTGGYHHDMPGHRMEHGHHQAIHEQQHQQHHLEQGHHQPQTNDPHRQAALEPQHHHPQMHPGLEHYQHHALEQQQQQQQQQQQHHPHYPQQPQQQQHYMHHVEVAGMHVHPYSEHQEHQALHNHQQHQHQQHHPHPHPHTPHHHLEQLHTQHHIPPPVQEQEHREGSGGMGNGNEMQSPGGAQSIPQETMNQMAEH